MSNVIPFKPPEPPHPLTKGRRSKAKDVQIILAVIDERARFTARAAPAAARDAARIRELVREVWERLGYRPLKGGWPDEPPAAS